MSACSGSCICGPGMSGNMGLIRGKFRIDDYAGTEDFPVVPLSPLAINRHFQFRPRSVFNIPVTRVEKPRYTVIDAHSHDYANNKEDVAQWVKNRENLNDPPRPYAISGLFEAGEALEHPKFGLGFVQKVIPPNKIEVMFDRLKDWRRIAMRYDRCAHTFFSAICLAAVVIFYLN